MEDPDAIVIGAGPAGLAAAASLQMQELRAVILDKTDKIGSAWRRHYDRLHLHTDRSHSGLPGLAMSSAYGRYPSRAQFVGYLELYAAQFNLKPVFNADVSTVRRENSRWRVEAGAQTYAAPVVVVATGWADFPYSPTWPGFKAFRGVVAHSSAYRNPGRYSGKRVLDYMFAGDRATRLTLCRLIEGCAGVSGAEPHA
jgi:cation diffusion facilitator CzcD-associated flavoprotein CzcO